MVFDFQGIEKQPARKGRTKNEQQKKPGSQVEGGYIRFYIILLGQWLNFKLFGITYLVGKIKFKLFFQGPLAEWVMGRFIIS